MPLVAKRLVMCRAPDPGLTHERLSTQGNGRG